jgi:predicted nucleic acid-binding protein
MAELIMIDTSILIDFYGKSDKTNSVWYKLVKQNYVFAVSTVTKYEIYAGATVSQLEFWDSVFKNITILSFDEKTTNEAVNINAILKKKNKQIAIADLFIAATAVVWSLPFLTLNIKHFERIDGLEMID